MALLAAFATGCAGDEPLRDDLGTVINAGSDSVFALAAGDCLDVAPDVLGEVADVPLVPCDEPHTQEVFGIVRHPDDAYPGASEVAIFADGACLSELDRSLGLTLDDGIYFSYLLPTFDGWNTSDDRDIVCVLVFPGSDTVTGSFVAGTAELPRSVPSAPSLPEPPDAGDGTADDASATVPDVVLALAGGR